MGRITNVLIAGVGGQGIVLASDIISGMALSRGLDVKKSEIHGMSQRGGVVYSFIRYGKKVFSPIPEKGTLDYVVSFEEMEALRWVDYANERTEFIVNAMRIQPASLSGAKAEYPDALKALPQARTKAIDALALAKESGSEKVLSSVMTGAFSALAGFNDGEFRAALTALTNKLTEENLNAFRKGTDSVK